MRNTLVALLLLPTLTKAQTIAQNADALLTAYSDQHKFSGTVLIAKEGKVVFEKAYGYADQKAGRLNTTTTEFRVGSLTKMFTSTLILKLAQTSKLSLTDPVSKYVKGITGGDSIKLIHLLTHTSGINGNIETEVSTLEQFVANFKTQSLKFTPGSQFEYNNFNYILLSYIAQKVTGVPYAKLLQTEVINKAGMIHSGLDKADRASKVKALGYTTNPETALWQEVDDKNVALAAGAGALYSTAGDLYKWSQALSLHKLLPDSMWTKAMQPFVNGYGMGWMNSNAYGHTQIGHTGSIPGFIANFMKFPKEDITVILLSNYQDVDGNQLSKDLAAVAFGEPFKLPVKKQAVALSADVLNKLVGEYRLPNGFSITVSVDGNKLYALAAGDPTRIELTPESETRFFLKGPETEVQFLEENGAKYMFVNMQGGMKFEKAK
ncbi:serine hydrolase [Flavisolibacter tropicus]|nr:serine hydrolase [Flavisolibacter tropicus]